MDQLWIQYFSSKLYLGMKKKGNRHMAKLIHHLKIDVHVRNRAMKNMELQGKEKEHQFA